MMAGPAAASGKAGPAALDKLFERTAKPRHRNMSVGGESAAQLFPFALVAIGAPGLNEFGDCGFIGKFHWLRLAHSHHKIARRRHAILTAFRNRPPGVSPQPTAAPQTRHASGQDRGGVCANSLRQSGNRDRTARSRRSEEHTSELQSHVKLVCRLLLEK